MFQFTLNLSRLKKYIYLYIFCEQRITPAPPPRFFMYAFPKNISNGYRDFKLIVDPSQA